MELFTNALIITVGILAGLFIFGVGYNLLRLALRGAENWTRNKQRELQRAEQQAYFTARRQKLEDTANQMMAADAELAQLVEAIRALPYQDANTKKARANNNQRAKLQKTLRERVPSKGIRDIFYGN